MGKKNSLGEQNQVLIQEELPPEFNYHMLRYALKTYEKNIQTLTSDEYDLIFNKAKKSFDLENLIINSSTSNGIIISSQKIDDAFSAIASQYESRVDLVLDLQNNLLDEESLRKALYRELLFDSIMQRVSEKIPEITDMDIQLFYEMHRERFNKPEKRLVYHILITINPEFVENTHQASLDKIIDLEEKLNGKPHRFKSFARRFSECPTAMEGGRLGDVVQGQLYPELDAELFKMRENEISQIIKTEMGFHLMMCEKIMLKKKVPLSRVTSRIRSILEERHQHNHQKTWLNELMQN